MTEAGSQLSLDDLASELALVREAGLEPLEVEALVPRLQVLASLGVVQHRTRTDTPLAVAMSMCQVAKEAASERLVDDANAPGPPDRPTLVAQAQMLLRVHYATKDLTVAEARTRTQESSGVGDRQYRARHEARLLRLVAQAILELDAEDDLAHWGRALEVGADVPQTVAMYWLYLFRDHYFRMETAAYALQVDLMTALSQLRDDMPTWRGFLETAVYWNVEFCFLRHRFFRRHGPLWFTPSDAGGGKLNDAVERIEYHDPFPEDFMARLRRLYGASADPDHDDFNERLEQADLKQFVYDKADGWLRRCTCPRDAHGERCEVGQVIRNCDVLGETVEAEFERIQRWYWNPRFAADVSIKDLILNYRTPGKERGSTGRS
ncbi:MAG: hypothetical protein ACRDOL_38650 [Streptosporangiaceae bacterium]